MQQDLPEEGMIIGMKGLSPKERRILLEERRKIMDQMDREKNANKVALVAMQADNFNISSTSRAEPPYISVTSGFNIAGNNYHVVVFCCTIQNLLILMQISHTKILINYTGGWSAYLYFTGNNVCTLKT